MGKKNKKQQVIKLKKLLPDLRDRCKLFVEFEKDSGSIHELNAEEKQTALGGIAMSLIQLKGGPKYFLCIVDKNDYPTTYDYSWEAQLKYLLSKEFKPWSCNNFCKYCDGCDHETNLILTAKKSK